jgi:dolichol-phosphate mannosyltransferase
MRNHGQHLAIWAGFEQARGKWVAVLDCDLQDDPSVLPELYRRALQGSADAVIVERGVWHDSWLRRISSHLFHHMMERLSGFRMSSNSGNFGIYSKRMVQALLSFEDKEVFLPAMAILTGLPRETMTVPRSERLAGRSSYSLKSLLRFASALIIRFSDRPLKASVVTGMLFSSLSAIIAAIIFMGWLIGSIEVQGWTSLMLSVWFIGGLILFALGIHGFYIGRIFNEVQRRPRIFVEQVTWDGPA